MQAKPLKTLIADYGVSFDATTIMAALVKSGHVENFTYLSTTGSGVEKSFRKLTPAGEQYGVNKSSMHDFKTEARFYAETFPSLLTHVVQQLSKEVEMLQLNKEHQEKNIT